jgi:uncharacterized protein (DUF58 family)
MPFSKFFSLLIAIGIVPLLAGIISGVEFYVFVIYNSLLFILLIIDYIITPGKKHFEIRRICDSKLSMGGENQIIISIRNKSGYPLDIIAQDEIPLHMDIKDEFVKIKVPPYSEAEGKYVVVPEKRGEFTFGKIHIKYNGILKLCSKKYWYDVTENYKVYPNLKDLSKYGLKIINKNHLIHGVKKVKSHGGETEFESLREYSEGDDYRKINWLATARANKLIVNTYEPEKNQQVMIMLDSSRVMNSEIEYIKKLDYSINASFLLADVAIRKGDNVGVMVFDSSVKRYVKPGKGKGQLQLIAENLYNVEENFVTANYKGALSYLNQNQKRRCLLCIFTELFNVQEAVSLSTALKNLARYHVPLVITIKDMRLYEIANGFAKNSEDIYLKAASIRLIDEREKIQKIFHDSGISVIDVPPDKLSVETVNKYLQMKAFI